MRGQCWLICIWEKSSYTDASNVCFRADIFFPWELYFSLYQQLLAMLRSQRFQLLIPNALENTSLSWMMKRKPEEGV